MIDVIYIEEEVAGHPRTEAVLERFPKARRIPCERYGEVFNRKAQSFRLQKRRPSLILAKKHGKTVLPTPAGYGIGAERNHYFSHMLNCLYDCRYCFLQGMYRSAHYVLFVNFEDFEAGIDEALAEAAGEEVHFFSGYDCDSLAFGGVTGFADHFLPVFEARPRAVLELRTKSTRIQPLLAREPLENCVVAVSLTPEEIAASHEHGAPALERRLEVLARLQAAGWPVGLRLDPVIYHPRYREQYRDLFARLFARIDGTRVHSTSLGPFRLPEPFFRHMVREYPDEALLAGPLEPRASMVSYGAEIEGEMLGFIEDELLQHIPRERYFPCPV
ncbi:MAG: DNA photolyase [Acidobacteria bacterium]|nr:DNA photolyase [Acidobacteriota bacterium]